MLQNGTVVNVEKLAVNVVSTAITRCRRLTDYIDSNDKTPVTDGHIDFYTGDAKSKAEIGGRVFVQVKGRTTSNPTKATKREIKFAIGHADLAFFRDNGGGIYFYVSMRPNGDGPEIFYSILSPFKIDRYLKPQAKASTSYSFPFKRLPSDTEAIEAIVKLAHHQRDQKVIDASVASLLENAQSISIRTLSGIDKDIPTTFRLDRDDIAISIKTPDGLVVPLDIDIEVLPADYTPREIALKVAAGEFGFSKVLMAKIGPDRFKIVCSDGLSIVLTGEDAVKETMVNLKLDGKLRSRLNDVNFFFALANGAPLVIDGSSSPSKIVPPAEQSGLGEAKEVLSGVIEILDYFGLTGEAIDGLVLEEKQMGDLLMLRDALLRKSELPVTGDGDGRWDLPIGEDKVIVLVADGSTVATRKLMDPFDLANRNGLVVSQTVDGGIEIIDWATVYDPLNVEDFVSALNLHLDDIVSAYESVPDERRYNLANHTVLKLILAADQSRIEERRQILLAASSNLNRWLQSHETNSLTNKINAWQISQRMNSFTDDDRRNLRIARRSEISGPDSSLYEACLVILLGYDDEVRFILGELPEDDLKKLLEWPIWALVSSSTKEHFHKKVATPKAATKTVSSSSPDERTAQAFSEKT
jgi:hypothetical protein